MMPPYFVNLLNIKNHMRRTKCPSGAEKKKKIIKRLDDHIVSIQC
jgi:hypothetical protein